MKKLNLLVLLFGLFILAGCVEQPRFTPSALLNEARGVTVARSTPYNCVILGEVEGRSEAVRGAIGANLQTLRDSAMNDAKNNAYYVAGKNKRIMIRIVNEKAVCLYNNKLYNCTNREIGFIRSYRINAQVFDCGEK